MNRAYFRATKPDMTLTPDEACRPFNAARAIGAVRSFGPRVPGTCRVCGKDTLGRATVCVTSRCRREVKA